MDEIFGPINLVMFTIKMDPGVVAKSFQGEDLVYISVDKLLPLTRFTNRECVSIVLSVRDTCCVGGQVHSLICL